MREQEGEEFPPSCLSRERVRRGTPFKSQAPGDLFPPLTARRASWAEEEKLLSSDVRLPSSWKEGKSL